MPSCPKCDAPLQDAALCERCGWHEQALAVPTSSAPVACPHDGATLGLDGYCPRGRGYPLGRACRFACPICRSPLDWSGGCETCHGCTTGEREDWTFPGDRYDCYDDKGQPIGDGRHWVKTDGSRAACTPTQNKAGVRRVQEILANAPMIEKPTRRRAR